MINLSLASKLGPNCGRQVKSPMYFVVFDVNEYWYRVKFWNGYEEKVGWINKYDIDVNKSMGVGSLPMSVAGIWQGQIGGRTARFTINQNSTALSGYIIYANVKEYFAGEVLNSEQIILRGVSFERLEETGGFHLDTFYGTIPNNGVTINGNYTDQGGHRGNWSISRDESSTMGSSILIMDPIDVALKDSKGTARLVVQVELVDGLYFEKANIKKADCKEEITKLIAEKDSNLFSSPEGKEQIKNNVIMILKKNLGENIVRSVNFIEIALMEHVSNEKKADQEPSDSIKPSFSSECRDFVESRVHQLDAVYPTNTPFIVFYAAGTPGGHCEGSTTTIAVANDRGGAWTNTGECLNTPRHGQDDIIHMLKLRSPVPFRYVRVTTPKCYTDCSAVAVGVTEQEAKTSVRFPRHWE